MRILLVEDEPKVASFIKKGLEENTFHVEVFADGESGLDAALSKNYDAIILDRGLPKMDGVEVCKAIRKEKPNVPILMLTALGSTDNKVEGFDAGADDYLVKPFEFMELLVRIKAIQKRNLISDEPRILRVADMEVNLDDKVVRRLDKKIQLTTKEFALLEYFIRNREKVISRADIAAKVWDIHFDTGTNVIDVYVNFLRKKIDKDFDTKLIHTVVGRGYILKENYK